LEAAASAARLAEDQARLEGRTLSASEKAQAQVGALEDLAGKFPTLRPLIQGYIDKLNEVPPSKATDVSVNDRASAVLANILRQLARISGQRYVADVSAGGAEPHAKGGPVAAGMPYLVGEEGPELFVPKRSGTIVPNRSGAMSGISAIGPASATVYDLRGAVIASDTELARRMRRAGQVGTLVGIG
jgi:hypothetical protein